MLQPHTSYPIFPILFPINFPPSHDTFPRPQIPSILPLDTPTYTAPLPGCHLIHHPRSPKSSYSALETLEVVSLTTLETLITKFSCGRVRGLSSSISTSTTKIHNISKATASLTRSVLWDLTFLTRTLLGGWMSCYSPYPRKDSGTRFFASIFRARICTTLLRELLTKLRPSLDVVNPPLLIFVNKGIETGTNALTLEIIADTCGKDIARVSTFLVSGIWFWSPKHYI